MQLSTMKTNRIKHTFFILLSVLFWIAVWHIAAIKIDSALIFPSPFDTLETLFLLIRETDFLKICLGSVGRIFLGAVVGIALGTLLAIVGHFIPFLKYLTAPIMTVVKTTPVASFIVLLLILIGKGPVPSVTSALIAVPILYANVSRAIDGIDKSLSEVCTVYSLSLAKRWRVLWLPSLMPSFISGMKSCIGLSWKAGIAAEVLCTPPESIGLKIHETRIYLETPSLFAWTAIVIVLSLIFEKGALLLLKERRRK